MISHNAFFFFLLILTPLFLLWKIYYESPLEKKKWIFCVFGDTFSRYDEETKLFKDNPSRSNLYVIRLAIHPFWFILVIMTNHNYILNLDLFFSFYIYGLNFLSGISFPLHVLFGWSMVSACLLDRSASHKLLQIKN